MKVMFYGIVPVFVFYTERFVPMGGVNYVFGPLCFILIKPKYKNDKGLHNHEMVHVKQHWRTCWAHFFKYISSDKYRLHSEAEAYAEQYASYPDKKHFDLFVGYMLDKYQLPFCRETIESELNRAIKARRYR